jgi:uncharacterized repeat protein (TIGR01451 family)
MTKHIPTSVLLLAALIAAPATAGTLRVTADMSASNSVNAPAGEYGFSVGNVGSGQLDAVRIVSDRGHAAQCSGVTVHGNAFAAAGSLSAGDSVRCVARPLTQSRARNASVVVLARDADGHPTSRTFSFAQPAALTPAQGIAVLAAGGIHNDTNGDGKLQAGETISYDYTLLNVGTLALSNIVLADIDGAETCAQTTLAVGAWTTCTHVHTITAGEESAGMVFNQVDMSAIDAGNGPVLAGDFVVTQNLDNDAGIRVFKSPLLEDDADASGYASAGDLVRYTFVVKNDNAQALALVNLAEDDAAHIDGSISCAGTTLGGQPFAGLGSGALASNDVVLCTADHTISATEASAGEADNLVEATAQPPIGGAVQGSGASAIVIPTPANVTLTKALTGETGSVTGVAEPGETLTYTITLSNSGGADALNVGVVDPLDANVVFASANHGGALSGSTVIWSGLTVPGNGSLVLSVTVTVANPIPSGTTRVLNLAYVTGTTPPNCTAAPLPAGCVDTPTPGAIQIAKALVAESGTQAGVAEPGETLTYTITLTNNGGSAVTGYGVSDPLDANVAFVSADHGGVHNGGIVGWSNLTIPAAGNLVLQVVVRVADPLPLATTHVVNLAYKTGSTPLDCNVVPVPAACVVTPSQLTPALQVTKTVSAGNSIPGATVTYTITVTNVGTGPASNVGISDPLPTGIASFAWTCAASGGVACANAQGSGAINESIAAFPVGGRLVYTVTAVLAANATGSVLNSVVVTPTQGALCMPQQTPAPCDATATVTVAVPQTVGNVPATGNVALLLMALGLVMVAWRRREQHSR